MSLIFNKLPKEIKSYIISFLVDNCDDCDKSEFYLDEDLIQCQKCKKKLCKYHRNDKINHSLCKECFKEEYSELVEDLSNMFSMCRQS